MLALFLLGSRVFIAALAAGVAAAATAWPLVYRQLSRLARAVYAGVLAGSQATVWAATSIAMHSAATLLAALHLPLMLLLAGLAEPSPQLLASTLQAVRLVAYILAATGLALLARAATLALRGYRVNPLCTAATAVVTAAALAATLEPGATVHCILGLAAAAYIPAMKVSLLLRQYRLEKRVPRIITV